ncbi:MAG TPA: helicase-related protein, partial [Mycobacterium sp.]|nr:helicase-related protein [Mycobacterium sp.]
HHAGMLPIFRHTVEELFAAGLVRAVFATETLALGINMPARTVVLERLVKFNGEQHAPLTPGEYTQLTGRAGRRGIDVEGHAVVLWHPDTEPAEVAGLASTRTFPLKSSFAPSYNMTINLVQQMGPEAARALLERSFAQYQADRSVVGLVRGAERGERMLEEIAEELGGLDSPALDYMRLRAKISEKERAQARSSRLQRRQAVNDALTELRRGDIINITGGRHGGLAVVLEPARDEDDPRPLVLSEHRWAGRISAADYSGGSRAIGTMSLPKRVEHRQPRVRRDLASALRSAAAGLVVPSAKGKRSNRSEEDFDPELIELREQLHRHPAHSAPDRETSARLGERYLRLERENAQLRQKIAAATNSLARTFDRIVGLLSERGFITAAEMHGRTVVQATDAGKLLARIYSESDLLVAECLRTGAWKDLAPAELAAMVSAVVFEARGSDGPSPQLQDVPTAGLRRALVATRRLSGQLRADENRHRLAPSREPDEGFVAAAYRWASTGDLASALDAADPSGGSPLLAGDFVRWCRQILDLLDQVRIAAPDATLRAVAKRAIDDVRRGVVAVDF